MIIQKWHHYKIWYPELREPHYKYVIVLCPSNRIGFFINSEPPSGRKARLVAIEIGNHQMTCLSKQSYIDTTDIKNIPDDDRLSDKYTYPPNGYGLISPSLKRHIRDVVLDHGVLSPAHMAIVASD